MTRNLCDDERILLYALADRTEAADHPLPRRWDQELTARSLIGFGLVYAESYASGERRLGATSAGRLLVDALRGVGIEDERCDEASEYHDDGSPFVCELRDGHADDHWQADVGSWPYADLTLLPEEPKP
jgi:hypothetical protein